MNGSRRWLYAACIALTVIAVAACTERGEEGSGDGDAASGLASLDASGVNGLLDGVSEAADSESAARAPLHHVDLAAAPASAAGGLDLNAPIVGSERIEDRDVDGNGDEESLWTFLSWDEQRFAAWASGGDCNLAWRSGEASWFSFGVCGAPVSHVCEVTPEDSFGPCLRCDGGRCERCEVRGRRVECASAQDDDDGNNDAYAGPINDSPPRRSNEAVTYVNRQLDPGAAARVAVQLHSCLRGNPHANDWVIDIYDDLSVWQDDPLFNAELVACLSGKNNGCDAVRECGGPILLEDPSCEPGCVGERLVTCRDGARWEIDCESVGGACDPAALECGQIPDERLAVQCSPDLPEFACEDDVIRHCSPVRRDFDCRASGGVCTGGDSDNVGYDEYACSGTGEECQTLSSMHSFAEPPIFDGGGTCLDEDVRETCWNGGLHQMSCSEINVHFSCQVMGADEDEDAFCGLASECRTDESTTPACNGEAVVLCLAGRVVSVDCQELGFETCAEGRCL